MAFPWVWTNGFENGTHGATASSGALISFPHYSELARQGHTPYRGAYCMKIALAGGTTSQFIREDTAFDDLDANGQDRYLRWYFYLGKDFVMAANDKFSMVEIESTLNTTTEVAAGIQRTSGNLEFWYNETAAAASPATIVLGTTTTALGRWYHAELFIEYDNAANNDGSITGYINDQAGSAIASLDQADAVDVKFGAVSPDAGTSGALLIDDIIYDDGRIYRDRTRYRNENALFAKGTETTAYDHPIIGPGSFVVAMTATGADGVLSLYDSDGVPDRLEPFAVIRNLTANEFVPGHDIFRVTKGCYATLTGTGAQAFFSMEKGGLWSDRAIIEQGLSTRGPRL